MCQTTSKVSFIVLHLPNVINRTYLSHQIFNYYSHIIMCLLKSLCSRTHCLKNLCVGACIFKALSLKLYSRQSSVYLLQLFLIPLLSFQCLQCNWKKFNYNESYIYMIKGMSRLIVHFSNNAFAASLMHAFGDCIRKNKVILC